MPNRKIDIEQDKKGIKYFIIQFEYRPQIVEYIRGIKERKYLASKKYWKVPVDHTTYKSILELEKEYDFDLSDKSKDEIHKISHPISSDIDIPTLKMELRPFQKEGVSSILKFKRCFLADDMGLGKTAQSIAAMEKVNSFPCLIICPASLKYNWQKEIEMWTDRKSYIVEGLPKEILGPEGQVMGIENVEYLKADFDFLIINYDLLYRSLKKHKEDEDVDLDKDYNKKETHHKDLLKTMNFKSIIIDESHMCKNYKSIRTKAVKELAQGKIYRLALSGTPMVNRPSELIPQLDILERLESMGGFWTYAKRYCNAHETYFGWNFSGFSNVEELHKKLKETCFIRRLKKNVVKDLPDKQRTMFPLEIDNRDEYNKLKKNFSEWLQNNMIDTSEYEKQLNENKLLTENQRKLLINARIKNKILSIQEAEAMVKIEYLKQITARGKLNRVKEFINNFLNSDEKLVIFASHKEIYNDLIDEYKGKCAYVVGGMNAKKKQEMVEKFQNNDKTRLFIGAIESAGVGLTLTKSSTVAFIEFGWTPSVQDQAEDRCHRIGQKNFVNVYYFYGKNTIDEYILEIIQDKRKLFNSAMDGKRFNKGDDIKKVISKLMSEDE